MKPYIRIILAVVVALVFLLPAATIATAAEPALRHHTKQMTLTLRTEGCTSPAVKKLIPPEYLHLFRAADLTWKGKQLKACWMLSPGTEEFLIVDETGDYGSLPMSAFAPVSYL